MKKKRTTTKTVSNKTRRELYQPAKIEPKWQKFWAESQLFVRPAQAGRRKKMYVLDMLPYSSGKGLHVGHVESYTAADILARYYRAQGFAVLHPTGFDSFGLPAENYAIKSGVHPRKTTQKNIATFTRQMKQLGFSYDWSRVVSTSEPEYYKWTQWIFLQLFKAGLAYEADVAINWCPSCKTGLANEEVIAGECERCGSIVGKKKLRQWLLKITQYADRLVDDLKGLDWPAKIIHMQENWVGRSPGVEVEFALTDAAQAHRSLTVFTTRADTLFGCTYLVVAPEHELARELAQGPQKTAVLQYISTALQKPEHERTTSKQKTGVFTGSYAVNPINNAKVPIWVADYVVASYGTGAVMAVPAHDERDFEFATLHQLPIQVVVEPDAAGTPQPKTFDKKTKRAFTADGRLVNSSSFDNLTSPEARTKIAQTLAKQAKGRVATHYKLRDWVFSRQRYWGEPIPIIHCKKCGAVAVPEEQLPVRLPEVEKYQPTGTGESPLAAIAKWVKVSCPKCAGPARRETNTMPQWAGSSWYFLRYPDPHNTKAAWTKESLKWLPVDIYVGGAEHAVLHLLYARFWVKALKDAGLLSFSEPFVKLRNQGTILADDGQKMSKSRGNVINPDEIVARNGADALRLFEMFLGPLEQEKAWSTSGIAGLVRFLERVWRLQYMLSKSSDPDEATVKQFNITTKVVTKHIEELRYNTAISALMQFTNHLAKLPKVPKPAFERLVILLHPFAPHIAEELWSRLGQRDSVQLAPWPAYDEKVLTTKKIIVVVQVNGRFRGRVELERGSPKEVVKAAALKLPTVKRALADKAPGRVVYVPDRVINLLSG
ncbi:MAG: leucine--tRNA ligase [Parcubacteria group bacterium]